MDETRQHVAYLIFDVEAVADGGLVRNVRYPDQNLTDEEAIKKYRAELLEKYGVSVSYPEHQTCCGQPMANAGFEHLAGNCNDLFINNFSGFDYIVSPSGSCVLHVKDHLQSQFPRCFQGIL